MSADPTSLPATDSVQGDDRVKQPSRSVPTCDPEKIDLVHPNGRVTQQTTGQTTGQTISQKQCPIF